MKTLGISVCPVITDDWIEGRKYRCMCVYIYMHAYTRIYISVCVCVQVK